MEKMLNRETAMKKSLSSKNVAHILKDLDAMDEWEPIDFTDVDFTAINNALRSGPAKKYLSLSDSRVQNSSPLQSDNEELGGEVARQIYHEPPKHLPMVAFAVSNFSVGEIFPLISSNFYVSIWKLSKSFFVRFFSAKKTAKKQVKWLLRNADTCYQKMRDNLQKLATEYDDNTFEILLLLPDLFVYMCRLLADKDVSKEYKVVLAFALLYVICPYDLIPQAFIHHPIAFMDDLVVALWAVKKGFEGKYVTKDQIEKYWPGRTEVRENIASWYIAVEKVLGKELIDKILFMMGKKIKLG